MTSNASMSRLAAISFLFAVACAHDHALDRRDVGAMKNASPAISLWPGPVADPVAVVSDVPPSLGLHIDLGEWEPVDGEPKESYQRVDLEDAAAVAAEIQRQVDLFIEILGRPPDHLDSHQHVHLGGVAREASIEAARRLDVPLRGVGRNVTVCGGFYGQQRDFGPYLEGVSFENLLRLLDGMPAGWNELTCHPGLGHDVPSVYAKEREVELETLCRPELRDAVAERHITLRDFRTVPSST